MILVENDKKNLSIKVTNWVLSFVGIRVIPTVLL